MEKFEKREIEEDDDEKKEQESAEAISGLKIYIYREREIIEKKGVVVCVKFMNFVWYGNSFALSHYNKTKINCMYSIKNK